MCYIAGAVLNMSSKLKTQCTNKYTLALQKSQCAVSTKTEAGNDSFQMTKVESNESVNDDPPGSGLHATWHRARRGAHRQRTDDGRPVTRNLSVAVLDN